MHSSPPRVLASSCIFGPSHAIRWQWHVQDGVVPCDVLSDKIHPELRRWRYQLRR